MTLQKTKIDVDNVVKDKVKSFSDRRLLVIKDLLLKDNIIRILTDDAEGMYVPLHNLTYSNRFLWIDLQLQGFAKMKMKTDDKIRKALRSLLKDLKETY
jgi:hypothetical protein